MPINSTCDYSSFYRQLQTGSRPARPAVAIVKTTLSTLEWTTKLQQAEESTHFTVHKMTTMMRATISAAPPIPTPIRVLLLSSEF